MTIRVQRLAKLQSIFRDAMDDSSLLIKETTTPEDLRAWDSMAQITLLFLIETEFGVSFTAKEAGELTSVTAILNTIEAKLSCLGTSV